jgi:CheY-like chemotaxis protein
MIATVMRTILARGEWEVRHSVTGEDAVEVAAAWSPTLILLDVDLPGINGFTVCSTVRAQDHGDKPLIVMVTANNDVPSKLMGFQVGADDYLVKPVDPAELLTRVTKLLDVREAQVRAIQQRRRDALNEIVATICHELNNPLTSVLGYLEMALQHHDAPAAMSEALADCRKDLLRVIDVVERLRRVEDRVVPYIGETTMIALDDEPTDVVPLPKAVAPVSDPDTDLTELDDFKL